MTDLLHWQPRQLGTLTLPTVDARELYDVLGITRPLFPAWIKLRLKEARLQENADFVIKSRSVTNYTDGRTVQDYYLSCFAAAHVAQLSKAKNANEVRGWCLAQSPQFEDNAYATTETLDTATRSAPMEDTNHYIPPYNWVKDPDSEIEHDGRAPQRTYEGWIKIMRTWNGFTTVVKIEVIRFAGHYYMEQLYPPRPKGYPRFLYGLPGGDIDCIPEAEALAWLTKHKLPLPATVDVNIDEIVDAAGEES